jgi:hypothetical protein
MNIAESWQGIKARLDLGLSEWGLVALVCLVGVASFGLGRLSALEDVRPPVSLEQAPTTASPQALSVGGLIVASKTGSVYYFPWCSGALKMTEQNKRWFADEASALAAGYTPSKSCKGLAGE